jgi:predicted nucleic-acid-binding protein
VRILDTAQFSIEDPDACREALALYTEGRGDFSDYLLGTGNHGAGCSATATFDCELRGSDLFRVL